MPQSWINGEPRSSIPIDDRGFAFGDGAFETLPVIAGRPALLKAHLDRLDGACHALGFDPPPRALTSAEIHRAIAATVAEGDALLRVTVTRGSGGAGYAPPATPEPRRIVTLAPLPARPTCWWSEGVAVRICDHRLRPSPLHGHKHLGRIAQVLARQEWDDPGIAEGLMLDDNDRVLEGTASNVLVQAGDELVSPPVTSLAVNGVMRRHVVAHANEFGLRSRERDVALGELATADAILLTNSIIGVWAVRRVGSRDRSAGTLARRIQQWLLTRGEMVDWSQRGTT